VAEFGPREGVKEGMEVSRPTCVFEGRCKASERCTKTLIMGAWCYRGMIGTEGKTKALIPIPPFLGHEACIAGFYRTLEASIGITERYESNI
jgi:hypothetical protein